MHAGPSAQGRSAPAAIVAGRSALARAEALRRAGHDAELEALAAAGLIVSWEATDGVYWTLTPLGAERLGLTLGERFRFRKVPKGSDKDALDASCERIEEEPYWTPAPVSRRDGRLDPLAAEVRLPERHRISQLGEPEWLADPAAPDAELLAQASECAELLDRFEHGGRSEKSGNVELLRKAEWIIPDLPKAYRDHLQDRCSEIRRRYLWDAVTDQPRLVMGQLAEVDGRLGPSKAG